MLSLRNALQYTMLPTIQQTLKAQLYELEIIETELHTTASRHGWELNDMDIAFKLFYSQFIRFRLHFAGSSSKIAAFVIRVNTNTSIAILTILHQTTSENTHLHFLAQKILDGQSVYIRRLYRYL